MKSRVKILSVVIPTIFFLDQVTKSLVVRWIPRGSSIAIIPGIFDLVHTRNSGAAFGFLANLPDRIRLPLFFIISSLALVSITVYFFRLKDERRMVFFYLALILGGALGNIWDRISLREVIDFLSFHWYDKVVQWAVGGTFLRFKLEWPAFNIADSAITVAVVGLMISTMRSSKT